MLGNSVAVPSRLYSTVTSDKPLAGVRYLPIPTLYSIDPDIFNSFDWVSKISLMSTDYALAVEIKPITLFMTRAMPPVRLFNDSLTMVQYL